MKNTKISKKNQIQQIICTGFWTDLDEVFNTAKTYKADVTLKEIMVREYQEEYSENSSIAFIIYRDETDEEMTERLKREAKWEEDRRKQELKDLERLKKKYEGK